MTRNITLLYRESLFDKEELAVAQKYFNCVATRTEVPDGSFVVGRYSVLPFYKELETELAMRGCTLINSYRQHHFIADITQWAMPETPFYGLTPRTWTRLIDVPDGIPLVLKGKTNSKKFLFNSHMFAANKKEAQEVYLRLLDDSLIGDQGIVIREYVPLKKLLTGFHSMPITVEHRLFVVYGHFLSSGYYWQSHVEDLKENNIEIPDPKDIPNDFLSKVLLKVRDYANFVVIDVGQLENGEWVVVELNDGQMSGLSCNDPDTLYNNLNYALTAMVV